MTIGSLYILCHPLIDVLGTICLIVLAAASTLYAIIWIIGKIWKFILTAGATAVLVVILAVALGVL